MSIPLTTKRNIFKPPNQKNQNKRKRRKWKALSPRETHKGRNPKPKVPQPPTDVRVGGRQRTPALQKMTRCGSGKQKRKEGKHKREKGNQTNKKGESAKNVTGTENKTAKRGTSPGPERKRRAKSRKGLRRRKWTQSDKGRVMGKRHGL